MHRNGSWGTVCDTCWHKKEAKMACNMLNCGEVNQFTAFVPALNHTDGSLWYFHCSKGATDLWQCLEIINNPNVCSQSKAAGLICSSK